MLSIPSPFANSPAARAGRTSLPRRLLWGLVLLALLLAQGMGQLHAVVHAPLAASAHADMHPGEAHEAGAHEAEEADGALAGLFAGHEAHGQDCRLYDQHGHSALNPGVPVLVLPAVPAAHGATLDAGCPPAAPLLPFEARGPPA